MHPLLKVLVVMIRTPMTYESTAEGVGGDDKNTPWLMHPLLKVLVVMIRTHHDLCIHC